MKTSLKVPQTLLNRQSLPRTEETNTSEGAGDTLSDIGRRRFSWHQMNLFLKRYELAIKCYTEAIEKCPADKEIDLATFHQNRLAGRDSESIFIQTNLITEPPLMTNWMTWSL